MKRGAGVLCHISSLPGDYGIGNLKDALRFARALAKSSVSYWQILPIQQTGFGDSPYQSIGRAGNPYFIDLDALGTLGLLKKSELKALKSRYLKQRDVDYGALYSERYQTLRLVFSRFRLDDDHFSAFVSEGKFHDYALFMTAKTVFGGSFCDWEEPIKRRNPSALSAFLEKHREEYLFWQFVQFLFSSQWETFRKECRKLGLSLIGDLPLYVAFDSVDVWTRPELFKLDENLRPSKVAGVPPDYFSPTGQLWGNPVYDWSAHEKEGFFWWKERLSDALRTFDFVRIDHFRGIDRYFEIPAQEKTAQNGVFQEGPKDKLFEGIEGRERLIAEDLGVIDEGTKSLLKRTGFPGMKVLLFAFDKNPENPHLPHLIGENFLVYTGTHDNDTVAGYVKSLSSEEFLLLKARLANELHLLSLKVATGEDPALFAKAFVEMALASKADVAIVPVQDLLGLDNSARMNLPGSSKGNWKFRLRKLPKRALKKFQHSVKNHRR